MYAVRSAVRSVFRQFWMPSLFKEVSNCGETKARFMVGFLHRYVFPQFMFMY